MYKKSIFIFTRDFRLEDNIGLYHALKLSEKVIPIFIFTPEQIVKNPYKSETAVQFMVESLQELNVELRKLGSKLFYFFGTYEHVLKKLIKNKIDAIFINKDYTPYAKKREKNLENICKANDTNFHIYEDYLLNPVGSVLTGLATPFLKYTPYFKKASRKKVVSSIKNKHKNYLSARTKIVGEFTGEIKKFYEENKNIEVSGGRKNALAIFKKIKDFKVYDKNRNFLTYHTTQLSAYIKFGCVSIREVFNTLQKTGSKDLIKQLYWRDFYYNIVYFFPHVFSSALKEKYNKIKWPNKKSYFEKWKRGQTGFPIVDACMRQLNTTGFMHNRGRLIVSNFLIKILLVDWKKGEKYFAQKLVDYDPSVNNGNWQWNASSGADSQPYFRIFNPWLQSKKFDPQAKYIKKWVPELQKVKAKDIHAWSMKYQAYKHLRYPKPIINYKKMRALGLALYKKWIY